jgi:iron complex transport system substrate-binding protein
MRIVSLLPSATEIVCELGLGSQLVGVTHECDHPSFVRSLPKVTRSLMPIDATSREIDSLVRERLQTERALYTLDLPLLEQLRPDLIVTQALCDVCAVAESEVLAAARQLPDRPEVLNLEPMTLDEVFECLDLVGQKAGAASQAAEAVAHLRSRVEAVERRTQAIRSPLGVVLLEWIDPLFCSGHWTPDLIRLAGGIELIGKATQPSRQIAWEEVLRADPDAIVIACCGFDVERTRKDLPMLQSQEGFSDLRCVRSGRVFVVDGNASFSRPGPRLVESLEMLAHTLHPSVHPFPVGNAADRVK